MESENFIRLPAPWKLITAWDFQSVKGIRIHRKCEASLAAVFTRIWNAAEQREEKIKEWRMHLYAGAYNFRLMRRGTKLSMHSWGCAVDFDSARNPLVIRLRIWGPFLLCWTRSLVRAGLGAESGRSLMGCIGKPRMFESRQGI